MERGSDGTSVLGGVAGFLVGIVPAGVGLLIPEWDILVPAGGLGAVTGAILGWRYAEAAVNGSWPAALLVGLRMAILAVVLGDVLACLGLALGASSGGAEGVLFGLIALPILGLMFVGLPALALALACAGAWVIVVRIVGRSPGTA